MTLWKAAIVAVSVTVVGCDFECTATALRCDGGVIEECTTHPAGIDVSTDPSVSRHGRSPNTWDALTSCGSASLCQTNAPAGPSDPPTWAICSLAPTPDPACATDAGASCSGSDRVECSHGFATARDVCNSCDAGACSGGVDEPCDAANACSSELSCMNGTCERACSCADGATCSNCDVLGQSAGSDAPTWTCSSGRCTLL